MTPCGKQVAYRFSLCTPTHSSIVLHLNQMCCTALTAVPLSLVVFFPLNFLEVAFSGVVSADGMADTKGGKVGGNLPGIHFSSALKILQNNAATKTIWENKMADRTSQI